MNEQRSHTVSTADEKAAARKALRDLYEDPSSPHRAELLKIMANAIRDCGIPSAVADVLADQSFRDAAYKSDDKDVTT